MEDINNKLDEFFETWKGDKHSRYLSWEHCYNFFRKNKQTILQNKKLLNEASLNLSVYLASWGMYRASSNTLVNDYKIHEKLIINLLEKCQNLWGKNIKWEYIEIAKDIIEKHYSSNQISPTKILTTKILLGIFACVPAYDTYFCKGLSLYNKNPKNKIKIVQNFNQNSFDSLVELLNKIFLKSRFFMSDKRVQYPPMRLIDAYFWWIGGGEKAHNKRAKHLKTSDTKIKRRK